jgi:hypothetical protein
MKRQRTAQEKKLVDDARLIRAWKKFHAEERATVLAGPHGAVLGELFRMSDNLAHIKPVQLIGFVNAINWTTINDDVRQVVLHEVGCAITKWRERNGLHPIDDALPGERPNIFLLIKERLFPRENGR